MDISELIKNLFVSQSTRCIFAKIPNEKTKEIPQIETTIIEADRYYFRIWLAEMFLKDDRKLFQRFVPVVHSVIKCQFGDKAIQELPYIAGPVDLNLSSNLGRGIQLNHPLTNKIPFRGGSISITTALVAYKNKDIFENLVSTVNNISGLLNVGQLSTVLKVVDSAITGIQNVVSGGDKDIHLVYTDTFAGKDSEGGNTLSNGYIAIINADPSNFNSQNLFVKNSQLMSGDDIASARPLNGHDYMLLRIELSQKRDDIKNFEDFRKLLNNAIEKGIENQEDGLAIMKALKISIYKSDDLIHYDKGVAYKAMLDTFNEFIGISTFKKIPHIDYVGINKIEDTLNDKINMIRNDITFQKQMEENIEKYIKSNEMDLLFNF